MNNENSIFLNLIPLSAFGTYVWKHYMPKIFKLRMNCNIVFLKWRNVSKKWKKFFFINSFTEISMHFSYKFLIIRDIEKTCDLAILDKWWWIVRCGTYNILMEYYSEVINNKFFEVYILLLFVYIVIFKNDKCTIFRIV